MKPEANPEAKAPAVRRRRGHADVTAPWDHEPAAQPQPQAETSEPQEGSDRNEDRERSPPRDNDRRRDGHRDRRGRSRRRRSRPRRGGSPRERRSGGNDGNNFPVFPPSSPTVPRVKPGKVGWIPLPFYNNLDSKFKREFNLRWMYAFRHSKGVHPRSHIILMEDAELQVDYEISERKRYGRPLYRGDWYSMLRDCADCCEKVRVEVRKGTLPGRLV